MPNTLIFWFITCMHAPSFDCNFDLGCSLQGPVPYKQHYVVHPYIPIKCWHQLYIWMENIIICYPTLIASIISMPYKFKTTPTISPPDQPSFPTIYDFTVFSIRKQRQTPLVQVFVGQVVRCWHVMQPITVLLFSFYELHFMYSPCTWLRFSSKFLELQGRTIPSFLQFIQNEWFELSHIDI